MMAQAATDLNTAPAVLRTHGLRKQYGRVTAVQDVSITVQQGMSSAFSARTVPARRRPSR